MQQMQQPANQPVINIINENVNQNLAAMGEERNNVAFIAGLIGGWLFGLLGIAHIFNGKIGQGLLYLFIGTGLLAIMGFCNYSESRYWGNFLATSFNYSMATREKRC
jgi:TM2 domain-containing membrane protein YozV